MLKAPGHLSVWVASMSEGCS